MFAHNSVALRNYNHPEKPLSADGDQTYTKAYRRQTLYNLGYQPCCDNKVSQNPNTLSRKCHIAPASNPNSQEALATRYVCIFDVNIYRYKLNGTFLLQKLSTFLEPTGSNKKKTIKNQHVSGTNWK